MSQKILLVDDTAELLENVGDCLSLVGYEVLLARNMREGLSILDDTIPDLIITDLMMGERSGFELIKEIKSHAAWKKIPLIIFSAKPLQEYKAEALALGVTTFIQKPSTLDELYVAIEKILKHE